MFWASWATSSAGELSTVPSRKTPDTERLTAVLRGAGAGVTPEADRLVVDAMSASQIGVLAAREGVVLHELTPLKDSLEDVFLSLTAAERGES